MPPRPSPMGSCASSPAPGWAATAFRSTRSTSPGGRVSSTCPPSSSSSPARSTSRCPTSASSGSSARSTTRPSRSTVRGSRSSASATRAASATSANRPRCGSSRRSPSAAPGSTYHDPYVRALPDHGLQSTPLPDAVRDADAVVLVTAHPEIDHHGLAREASLFIDLRGVTRKLPDREPSLATA